MALRKEDIDNNDERADQKTKRTRITFDINPELRRRIKMTALQHDLSISDYLGSILEQAVPGEASLTQQEYRPMTRETLEHILQVHKEIKEHTGGYLFEDSTELIRQMREERSQELEQL
jgi:hypothetical protein